MARATKTVKVIKRTRRGNGNSRKQARRTSPRQRGRRV